MKNIFFRKKETENRNYTRYNDISEVEYNHHNLSYYLMRKPSDKKIIPYLKSIKGRDILEVGAGYGYYTKYLLKNNDVEVADVNPYLCQKIGVQVYECEARQIAKIIKKEYDFVLSFWLTEYLNPKEMEEFIHGAMEILKPGGIFLATVILNMGMGKAYTFGAGLKGINKYGYSVSDIHVMSEDCGKVNFRRIDTYLGIPFATLLKIKKDMNVL